MIESHAVVIHNIEQFLCTSTQFLILITFGKLWCTIIAEILTLIQSTSSYSDSSHFTVLLCVYLFYTVFSRVVLCIYHYSKIYWIFHHYESTLNLPFYNCTHHNPILYHLLQISTPSLTITNLFSISGIICPAVGASSRMGPASLLSFILLQS